MKATYLSARTSRAASFSVLARCTLQKWPGFTNSWKKIIHHIFPHQIVCSTASTHTYIHPNQALLSRTRFRLMFPLFPQSSTKNTLAPFSCSILISTYSSVLWSGDKFWSSPNPHMESKKPFVIHLLKKWREVLTSFPLGPGKPMTPGWPRGPDGPGGPDRPLSPGFP